MRISNLMDEMEMNFKSPTKTTYQQVLKIYSQYQFDPEKQDNTKYLELMKNKGFLVGDPLNFEDISQSPFSLSAEVDGHVAGFIRLDNMSNEMCNEKFSLKWSGSSKQWKQFTDEEGYEIGLVMVHPEHKGKGVAGMLLEQAENFAKNKSPHIFSWVVSSPKNKPSIEFHKKNGFNNIAEYNTSKAWGIRDYQSLLFYKILSKIK